MNQKVFILTIKKHIHLGYLLLPFLAEKGETFYSNLERIAPGSASEYEEYLSEKETKIIELTDEYAEKEIFQRFGNHQKQNQVDFYEKMDPDFFEKLIRPVIDKKMIHILDHTRIENIPVYLHNKEKSIYIDQQVTIAARPADTVFHFVREPEGILYHQTIMQDDSEISLKDNDGIILVNQPCRLILNNTLYSFSDSLDGKKLIPFFTKDHIFIPHKFEQQYFEKFISKAVKSFPVKAKGFHIEESDGHPKPVLSLEKDWAGKSCFILHFKYGKFRIYHDNPSDSIIELKEKEGTYYIHKTQRNRNLENDFVDRLHQLGLKTKSENSYTLSLTREMILTEMINWINRKEAQLRASGFILSQDHFNNQYFLGNVKLKVKYTDDRDWFDVKAVVHFGDYEIPFVRLRKNILQGIQEYVLPDGTVAILPSEWFSKYREILALGDSHPDHIRIRKHHFKLLKNQTGLPTSIKSRVDELSHDKLQAHPIPEMLNAELRDYQKEGFHWLAHLYKHQLNGCLADDMGLGKTLQAITVLCFDAENNKRHGNLQEATPAMNGQIKDQLSLFDIPKEIPEATVFNASLIIMPTSLIHNWQSEFSKFAPGLKILEYGGLNRGRIRDQFKNADIILGSYGIIRNDIEYLEKFPFRFVILDESQIIKNPSSKTYKAILRLTSRNRIALSGTPIENSLLDLWSQMNFLNRGLLGTLDMFKHHFIREIEQQKNETTTEKLKNIINPFILRRTKQQVAKELPPITEQVRYCEMTTEQRGLYDSEKSRIRNYILDNIEKAGLEKSAMVILNGLNTLRQLACHPAMNTASYLADSGKFIEVSRIIMELTGEGHKVLVFSSFVRHLNLFKEYLESQKVVYSMLTGETRDRGSVVQAFKEDQNCKVFLISIKAGGLGLNLTEAGYVFILDPWWNPAVERQAIDRAYRIGQDKNVFVYRFLTEDSVEEKIQKIQGEKKELAEMFVNNNNPFFSYEC